MKGKCVLNMGRVGEIMFWKCDVREESFKIPTLTTKYIPFPFYAFLPKVRAGTAHGPSFNILTLFIA